MANELVTTLAAGISRRRVSSEVTAAAIPYSGGGGWFGIIREAWSGAFQQGIVIDAPREVLAFSAVFACVTGIATDIAKLGVMLKKTVNGVSTEIFTGSPFLTVLRRPNRFQTWYKFMEQWIVSKLLFGNTYVIKERDQRGVVVALYILDPQRVVPLVAEDGAVYYRLAKDYLAGLEEGSVVVPAEEIIHDMGVSLWHPLVGVSPIYACGSSATQGNRIQSNSTRFFANMSRPSGGLTSPNTINNETAERLKKTFEENFSGQNIGRLFIAGDGLKYDPMTIPASDAQLIEQLKWTVEDVARCFHYPLWKLGAATEPVRNVESLNQSYYSDCLQGPIESAEALLVEGMGLPNEMYVEFNLKGLLRMDTAARYEAYSKGVNGGWMHPNYPRNEEGMPPVAGGDVPYLQQQNYSLGALAKRDAKPDPFDSPKPEKPPASPTPGQPPRAANDSEVTAELVDRFVNGLSNVA